MLSMFFVSALLLTQGQPVQSQAGTSQAQPVSGQPAKTEKGPDPRIAVPVAAEVKLIEQDTLLPDGMLATVTGSARDTAPRKELSEVTGQQIYVGMPDMDESSTNGLRIFAFTLEPHETLDLRLHSKQEAIVMRILKPKSNDAMARAIASANFPPTATRRSRLSIQNSTARPYTVNLLLYGKVGYPYRLDIERKP